MEYKKKLPEQIPKILVFSGIREIATRLRSVNNYRKAGKKNCIII